RTGAWACWPGTTGPGRTTGGPPQDTPAPWPGRRPQRGRVRHGRLPVLLPQPGARAEADERGRLADLHRPAGDARPPAGPRPAHRAECPAVRGRVLPPDLAVDLPPQLSARR